MLALKLASVVLSLALAYAAPSCTPDYGKLNSTISSSDTNLRSENANVAHVVGIYGPPDNNLSAYKGFVSPIVYNFGNLDNDIPNFTTTLQQAVIKCNTCTAPDGTLEYADPYKNPVVTFQSLQRIFSVGSNIISNVLYKYCGDVNNGICKNDPNYCRDAPPGQEKPDKTVQMYLQPYIQDNLAAFGSGAASAKGNLPALQKGAVYPYYKCLATYGSADDTKTFEDKWFGFLHKLLALNGTACV